MRAFLAIRPPQPTLTELDRLLEPRRDADPSWRWAPTGLADLHLTLAFLGELPDWREEALAADLADWATRHTPLSLAVAGAGGFPHPGAAKVLWVGVTPAESVRILTDWSRQLRALGSHHGAAVDGQRFTPHLTVARSGRPRRAGPLVQALDTVALAPFVVEEVLLVESHLGEGPGRRPRYDVRAACPLGRA